MKRFKLREWQTLPEFEGLFIFSLVLDELLFTHTIDLYKSASLNLHWSIQETRSLVKDVVKRHGKMTT